MAMVPAPRGATVFGNRVSSPQALYADLRLAPGCADTAPEAPAHEPRLAGITSKMVR